MNNPSSKRHVKPTTAQLLSRIYRRQIAMSAELAQLATKERDRSFLYNARMDGLVSAQKMLSTRMESFRVLVDHCHRLLREKETLQREVDKLKQPLKIIPGEPVYNVQMASANAFIAKEIPTLNHETKEYSCGCNATGPDPLPDHCGVHGSQGAPNFQAARHGECAFASSHRLGVICQVCGQ